MNTDERVQEAMQSLRHITGVVDITHLSTDVQERDLITTFPLDAGV